MLRSAPFWKVLSSRTSHWLLYAILFATAIDGSLPSREHANLWGDDQAAAGRTWSSFAG